MVKTTISQYFGYFKLIITRTKLIPIFLAYLIYLHFHNLTTITRLKHDLVSWALPALGAIQDWGNPYLDFWDIKPPGLIILTHIWMLIFGGSVLAFQLLHICFISIIVISFYLIIKENFPTPYKFIVPVFTTFILINSGIQTQFTGSELYGLALALLGLYLLIKKQSSITSRIRSSTFLFVFAGQMKEPYIFTILTVLPYLIQITLTKPRQLKPAIYSAITGTLLAVNLVLGYLLLHSSLNAYFQVLTSKQQMFLNFSPIQLFPRTIEAIEITAQTLLASDVPVQIILLLSLLAYISIKFIKQEFTSKTQTNQTIQINFKYTITSASWTYLILLTYIVTTFLGMAIQYRFNGHYLIPVIPSIILLILIPLTVITIKTKQLIYSKPHISKPLMYGIYGLTLFLILPRVGFFLDNPYQDAYPTNTLSKLILAQQTNSIEPELRVRHNTQPGDCIMSVYGWGAGGSHYYSHRPPCSRFFLTHIMQPKYYSEYTTDIINHPPAAIMYYAENADFDIATFEEEVFNYQQVLEHCYQPDTDFPYIYFPIHSDQQLPICIRNHFQTNKQLPEV